MKQSRLFTLWGFGLGMGAPFGILALRFLFHDHSQSVMDYIPREWAAFPFFYWYMLVGTCFVFALFGFWVGREDDRLIEKDRALSKEVLTDPLTGLGNHRFLHDTFKIEFRKHLDSRQPISCLMMDLDFFKRINDSHGHPFGDMVLRIFSRIIENSIRRGDIATRYGGEEFLCILPNCGEKEAKTVAERIRRETEKQVFRDGPYDAKITVSIGIVTNEDPLETNYHAMIDAADKNLYEAKRRGRNQVFQTAIPSNPCASHPQKAA